MRIQKMIEPSKTVDAQKINQEEIACHITKLPKTGKAHFTSSRINMPMRPYAMPHPSFKTIC
jgi:hypothetical protein